MKRFATSMSLFFVFAVGAFAADLDPEILGPQTKHRCAVVVDNPHFGEDPFYLYDRTERGLLPLRVLCLGA